MAKYYWERIQVFFNRCPRCKAKTQNVKGLYSYCPSCGKRF